MLQRNLSRWLSRMADDMHMIAIYSEREHIVRGERKRSVVMVDPSCYSLPYDYSLCQALASQGWSVALERSRFLYGDFRLACDVEVRERFYRVAHQFSGSRGMIWKCLKGVEHVSGTMDLLRRARKERPDIIHYQWLTAPAVEARFFEHLSRIAPLVLTLHNTTLFHGKPCTRFQGLGFRSVFKHLDAVIVHSEYSKRRIVEENWITPENVHVIPHGVLDLYARSQQEQQLTASGNVILFFGAIAEYKGLDVLLRAFAKMPDEVRDGSRIVVAGRPNMNMEPIFELARELGIESRIEWRLRFLQDDEVLEVFRMATVVALPYREIDQSGVLLTAIGFDKPVVATRIGGIAETIEHGKHGMLVEPGNADGFAQSFCSVLEDTTRRESMQQEIRQLRVNQLSWESIGRRTIGLYESLIARRSTIKPAKAPVVAAV